MIVIILTLILFLIFPIIFLLSRGIVDVQILSTSVWYLLASVVIIYFLQSSAIRNLKVKIYNFYKTLEKKWLNQKNKKFIVVIPILLFLLISGLQKRYYLGGDDTRLFYLYPEKFYSNFVTNIATDTSISGLENFLSANSISLFLYLMILLKTILGFLNLQSLLYSLNLVLGFYFFFILFKYLVGNESKSLNKTALISSFMYVFSIFNFYTLFNSRLISIFILSIFPLSIYVFIRAIREKKFYFLIFLAILVSVFAVTSVAGFWFFASLITVTPIIFYNTWNYKSRLIGYTLAFLFLLFLINLHWFIYLPYGTMFSQSGGVAENSLVSENFANENIQGIISTAENNSVFYPLMNTFHYKIQKDFNWPYLPIFQNWYLRILPLNLIFLAIILFAGLLLKSKSDKSKKYIVFSTAFLLAIYFFTVNLGNARLGNPGIELFTFLARNVPGFIIFRNMYDKFAHAVAFNFALVFGFSLFLISNYFNKFKHINNLFIIPSVILLLNAAPFLLGKFNKVPIWTTKSYYLGVEDLDRDFLELTEHVKDQEYRGRYLFLPMNRGNLSLIKDEFDHRRFYSGVSPFLIFTGKNDLSGILSFGPFSDDLQEAILEENIVQVKEIVRRMNARYVIVQHDIPDELQRSYMFSDNFYHLQDDFFINQFIGNKIKDFGQSYSMYEISPELLNEKIFLSSTADSFPVTFSDVTFEKVDNATYKVNISSLKGESYLNLLEPYLSEWKIYFPNGSEFSEAEHLQVFEYANAWRITPEMLTENHLSDKYTENPDGSLSLNLIIYFKPYRYYKIGQIISFATIAVGLSYVIWKVYHDTKI